jgi:AcrR family transcriptional regulator
MARTRINDTTIRVAQILDAAVTLAEEHGYNNITREAIAEVVGCSPGLVSKHMGTMLTLKRSIVSAAIARENLTIVAQALVDKHPKMNNADDDLKRRAMAFMLGE